MEKRGVDGAEKRGVVGADTTRGDVKVVIFGVVTMFFGVVKVVIFGVVGVTVIFGLTVILGVPVVTVILGVPVPVVPTLGVPVPMVPTLGVPVPGTLILTPPGVPTLVIRPGPPRIGREPALRMPSEPTLPPIFRIFEIGRWIGGAMTGSIGRSRGWMRRRRAE